MKRKRKSLTTPPLRTLQLMRRVFSSIQSPLSETMMAHLTSGDFTSIISASVNPMDYQNADDFRRDYLLAEIFSKNDDLDLGLDRREVAISKMIDCEYHLYWINRSLPSLVGPINSLASPHSVIFTAARKIKKLLGSFCLDEMISSCNWGPGASVSLPRTKGDAYYKFSNMRKTASPLVKPYIDCLARWWEFPLGETEYIDYSKTITVPKNAKTDRCIAIEPDWNMFFQKGIGAMIRSRLKRVGLLHADAQAQNGHLAMLGSRDGDLATVDLSSASDSISLALVKLLLPEDWYSHCFAMRTPYTLVDGRRHFQQKFSSMGNGYTFELETLIFWALSSSVLEILKTSDRRLLVYGDDIIINSEVLGLLEEVFRVCGFTINTKKTFSSGPFRESCGKHYFNGVDVTPFYIRKKVSTLQDYFILLNNLTLWSRLLYGRDSTFKGLFEFLLEQVPKKSRIAVPIGLPADSGIYSDFDQIRPQRARRGIEGYVVRYYRYFRRPEKGLDDYWLLKKYLYFRESSDLPLDHIEPLHVGGRYVINRTTVTQFPSIGPFL